MDASNKIALAMAMGAAANFKPNVHETDNPVMDAYVRLRALLDERYPRVSADMMDVGPGSEERRQALAQQLAQAGADEDTAVLRQADVVIDAAYAHLPAAARAAGVTWAELGRGPVND